MLLLASTLTWRAKCSIGAANFQTLNNEDLHVTSTFRLQVHILTNHFRHRELSLLTATPSKTLFSVIFYRRLITGLHRNDIEAVIVTSKGLYQHNCVQTFPGKYRRLANIYIEREGGERGERERERERETPLNQSPGQSDYTAFKRRRK